VTQPGQGVQWGSVLLPLDFDGDGRTELVYAYSNPNGDGNQVVGLAATKAAGSYPDLMVGVTDGLGGQYTVTYAPLTEPAVYTEAPTTAASQIAAGTQVSNQISGSVYNLGAALVPGPSSAPTAYAMRLVDFPKYVTASYNRGDGRGNSDNFTYAYSAARLDLDGRGWLGFASVTRTDPQAEIAVLTEYNQPFPLTHLVAARITTRSTDGALMQRVTQGYQTAVNPPNTGPGVQIAWNNSIRTDDFTFAPPAPAPVPDATELQEISFDDLGNPAEIAVTGSACGAPSYTFQTWLNDTTSWHIGYLSGRKVAADSAGQQVLTSEQMSYDPATWAMTARQVWNDQGTGAWLVTQYAYDACGNQVQVTDPSGAVFSTAYDSQYATFPARITQPPNAAGVRMSSALLHFPQCGVLQQHTDPNDVVTGQAVDGLGRVVATTGPGPAGDTVTLTQISYGSDSQGIYRRVQARVDWAGKSWRWERHYLDGLSRPNRTASLGADGASTVYVDRSFDSCDNVVQESLPYFEGGTPLYIQRTYDAYGRLIQSITPLDSELTTTMQVNWLRSDMAIRTEAVGMPEARTTRTAYALFNGKLLPVGQTVGAATGEPATRFSYDALGRLVEVVDPIGVVTATSLDSLNRPVKIQVHSGEQVFASNTFAYDDARAGSPRPKSTASRRSPSFRARLQTCFRAGRESLHESERKS
jgi:YD repeat-containing protein